MRRPLFVEEVYDYVFDTGIAMIRAATGSTDEVVSIPIAKMLIGVMNDWERGAVIGPTAVQSAYDFSLVYREILDREGMEVIGGNIVGK